MQTIILDVSANKAQPLTIDAAISFEPFVAYLRKRVAEEHTVKAMVYQETLQQLLSSDVSQRDIPLAEIIRYGPLLEYIYACLSPAMRGEQDLVWGLSFPFQPITFYGTDQMYELMDNKGHDHTYEVARSPAEYHMERLRQVYVFILQRLYNFQAPVRTDLYHAGINKATGLLQYYAVHINTDFMTVTAKEPLPEIDFVQLYTSMSEGGGFEVLQQLLPLDMFRFRGFCVVTVTDITAQKAVENIRQVRLSRTALTGEKSYQQVIQSLKSLLRNSKIEFDLFPFLRVNDEPVFGFEKGGTGILFQVWGEDRLPAEEFRRQVKGFSAKPVFYFSSDIFLETRKEYAFLEHFRKLGVKSLALMPLYHVHELVGVLAVHTWGEETFGDRTLALLEPAIAALAQLLQIYIDEFNLEIEKVIKEKFTSIQPAVQWKFNEAAWQYLYQVKRNQPAVMLPILFKEVYPLYGAIDIRNSTVERNKAIIADLDGHLSLLASTLDTLRSQHEDDLLKEMIFHCLQWQQALLQQQLSPSDENELNRFLEVTAVEYLQHVAGQYPQQRENIDVCIHNLSSDSNKDALEKSMRMINQTVNGYFESEKSRLQESYPCYFEKFRTDGVEYDIYIGQAIAPNRPFNHLHLKHIRLWQLSSMVAVARLTQELLTQMPKSLYTTQLIFVHAHPIDIGFRVDERKFDVEGAYNIRYQMIKKRIDKVHIRDTEERLTQPGKIALIYSDPKDLEDYLPFIRYLQESGELKKELEELELEELQGLKGLKAIRVEVVFPEAINQA
ncbi:hypothetical protein FHW36_108193 [Chitinophaga polysaccharea]|uniref:GAF domain-containing protein n=1 Tax=Chitinophaga polysaccharea TaxID=1293035 RepID=A0A561PCJ0_9BACT|nr:GAF domain-containing protein [Chitinophaga polysaccharea]TWF35837.1 hypothetical protein FHW36_108193 [Chitinophaga polysaccharea]